MPTVYLSGSLRLLDSLVRALISTLVDYETKSTSVRLPLVMMVNRNVIRGSTILSVKSPSCEMSGEMRRMCFPFPVASQCRYSQRQGKLSLPSSPCSR